jgi:hypothetical protein
VVIVQLTLTVLLKSKITVIAGSSDVAKSCKSTEQEVRQIPFHWSENEAKIM